MHSNMRISSAALIIAIVLIIGFVLSVPHVRDLGANAPAPEASSTPLVYIHDAYKKGTHTIGVKVAAPDACAAVSGTISPSLLASTTPDTIIVALTMTSDTGICLQEPATTTLSLTAAASSGARIRATINGTNASTTSY